MDADRFDILIRTLADAFSRRGLSRRLTALTVTSVLGSLGINAAEGRKRCGPCRKKKHGKCKKTRPDSTPCGVCLACQGGQCVNACGICEDCLNGSCVPKPNDASCDGSGKCLAGICNPVPTCLPAVSVTPCESPEMPALCCSGHCCEIVAPDFKCCKGQAGTPCFGNEDCGPGLVCSGYRCI